MGNEVKEDNWLAVRRGPARGCKMTSAEIVALRHEIAREVLKDIGEEWSGKSDQAQMDQDELLSVLLLPSR